MRGLPSDVSAVRHMQISAVCKGDVGRTTAIWRTIKNKQSAYTNMRSVQCSKRIKEEKVNKIGT